MRSLLTQVPLRLGFCLAASIILGVSAAVLFLSAAGGDDLALPLFLPLSLPLAVLAALGVVAVDLKPYLGAFAAPASLGPEEGRRAAGYLARVPDRIALIAGAAAFAASVYLGWRARETGFDVAAVGALLAAVLSASLAIALADWVTSSITMAGSHRSETARVGLGIGDRVLLLNGGTAIVALAAFGLIVRADVSRHKGLGLTTLSAGMVLAAILLAAAWYSARSIRGSMGALVREVQQITAGDLTRTVSTQGGGEIAMLSGALGKMSGSIRQILNNIKSVSSEVAAASEDIAVSSSVMAGKIKDQAEAVDSISGAVTTSTRALVEIADRTDQLGDAAEKSSASIVEMMASIRSVAENAEQLRAKGDDSAEALERIVRSIAAVSKGAETLFQLAERSSVAVREIDAGVHRIGSSLKASRDLAEGVSRDAREGGDAVRSLILAVDDIQHQVDDVAKVVMSLDRKSWEISSILDVITDIADQTALLALNAAIIAAQAGERGKGFAVIADEIKGLADRTGNATKDIGRVIREVKKEVLTAGQGMGSATAKSAEGVRLSKSAGRALDDIIRSAEVSQDKIAIIAAASEQAQAQSREIVSAVSGVTKVAGELRGAVGDQEKAGHAAAERMKLMRAIALQVAKAMEEQALASRTIVEAVENSLAMVQAIGGATADQKKDAERIQQNLEDIRTNALANTESVSDLERVVQTLIQEAVVLRHEIDRFKMVETRTRKTGFD